MNESTPADATAAVTPDNRKKWLGALLTVLEPLSVVALFIYLLWKTWLRWGDPLVDFPRDLYIAWRVSEGDLLYQKISNWYGPLSNLLQGAAFKIFGVGMDTMVWTNIVMVTAALLLLRAIFGSIGNRLSKWLVSILFLSVFAFGDYVVITNYNFITPYVSQATYSFLGLLLVLWGLLRNLRTEKLLWLDVAGFGLAVAYLDKPEATLAATGTLAIYLTAQAIHQAQSGNPAKWLRRALGSLGGGFLCLWLPVFIYFWLRSDAAFAWHAVNFVPYSLLNSSIRDSALHSPTLQLLGGFDDVGRSLSAMFQATGLLGLTCALIAIGSRQWTRAVARSFSWWFWLLVACAPVLAFIGWRPSVAFWERSPSAFVIPVCLATLVCCGWSLWEARRNGGDFSRALGLAVVGVAASLTMVRIILNARFSFYGVFMMPLAIFFCLHLMFVEAARPTPTSLRGNCLLPVAFLPIVLMGCGAMVWVSMYYYGLKTLAVGSGRDRFYALPPPIQLNGWQLNTMLEAYQEMKPRPVSLAVFPEGIAVNYHLRLLSPLTELEHTPLALSYAGPGYVLAELRANPPQAVFLHSRNLMEFGVPYFGANEASGRDIALWFADKYKYAGYANVPDSTGPAPNSITGHALDFFILKTTPN